MKDQVIDNSIEGLAPKVDKSNIPTRKLKKASVKKTSEKERRLAELSKVKDAQIIFGFDNGATRNDLLHCSV